MKQTFPRYRCSRDCHGILNITRTTLSTYMHNITCTYIRTFQLSKNRLETSTSNSVHFKNWSDVARDGRLAVFWSINAAFPHSCFLKTFIDLLTSLFIPLRPILKKCGKNKEYTVSTVYFFNGKCMFFHYGGLLKFYNAEKWTWGSLFKPVKVNLLKSEGSACMVRQYWIHEGFFQEPQRDRDMTLEWDKSCMVGLSLERVCQLSINFLIISLVLYWITKFLAA